MLSKLMILAPIVGIVFVFYAANSYGSEREVLLGTDWAILIKDDPNYQLIFNLTLLLSIVNASYAFMASNYLEGSYNEKVNYKLQLEVREKENQKEKARKDKCDYGFIEDPNNGLCYHPKDHDWDWDTDSDNLEKEQFLML